MGGIAGAALASVFTGGASLLVAITGIIAGGPMRAVFETMGIQDIVAKSQGSQNPHNMIRATFAALQAVNSPRIVAAKRSKKVGDIVSRREGVAVEKEAVADTEVKE